MAAVLTTVTTATVCFFFRYGFNIEGFNRLNEPVTINIGTATGRERFDEQGYDWQGMHLSVCLFLFLFFFVFVILWG